MLHGALAAAVTPLLDGGEDVDQAAVAPYVDFLAGAGLDGIFALGTTGEGILLSAEERRAVAARFVEAAEGRLAVAVHCGAQTTGETVALCAHAAELGADAVAVIGPPYYELDDDALLAHFSAAADACSPLPFYVYEFSARAGYAVPVNVLERLRERALNFAGLKVSDSPLEHFEPYLIEGLDVFVGPESLIGAGLARGAAGAVSGLAAAFPEAVAELVKTGDTEIAERVTALRDSLQRFPFNAAAKAALVRRGVPVREDVRAPLRLLTSTERIEVENAVDSWLESRGAMA